jgi:hypothetical protein
MDIQNFISKINYTGYLYLTNVEKEKQCVLFCVDEVYKTATFIMRKWMTLFNKLSAEGKDTAEFLSNKEYVEVFSISEIKDFITDKGLSRFK